jgi:hypothetical protein
MPDENTPTEGLTWPNVLARLAELDAPTRVRMSQKLTDVLAGTADEMDGGLTMMWACGQVNVRLNADGNLSYALTDAGRAYAETLIGESKSAQELLARMGGATRVAGPEDPQ